MSTTNDDETNGFLFQWKIENVSHSWWLFKGGQASPSFIADKLDGTKWSLWLYFIGQTYEDFVGIYLHRNEDCTGPDVIEVNFQFAFLGENGSLLTESDVSKHGFQRNSSLGFKYFESRKKMFLTEREKFLSQDALTVQCTLWRKDESLVKSKHLSAKTVFGSSRSYFAWNIRNFSSVKAGLRKKFKDDLLDIDLVLNADPDKRLDIDVISLNYRIGYISCNTSVTDSEGKKENCDIKSYFASDLKAGVLSPVVLFPKRLMENKNRYLPNGILSLDFEFVIWTYESVQKYKLETRVKRGVKRKTPCAREKPQNTQVLATDMKSIFNEGIFSDAMICTPTKTFPVHRNILSARSPVFRSMFSNDMKEKNSGTVDIADFKNDTVHRMLLYMYTDSLENLTFASASHLYAAADKYEILSLRSRCSSFLQDNLRPSNACLVLILADRHQDDDLKNAVQSYILVNDDRVFSSLGWKTFLITHPQLAVNVMKKVVKPGKN